MPRKAKQERLPTKKQLAKRQALDILKKGHPRDDEYGYMEFFYGAIDTEGALHDDTTHVCHSTLNEFKDNEVIYTFTPQPQDCVDKDHTEGEPIADDIFQRYIKWLTLKSPWARLRVFSRVSAAFATKHGFIITDMKQPANLVANFCIATRQPFEHQSMVTRWDEFVKAGVEPSLAFVFAEGLYGNNYWRAMSNGHDPMDIESISHAGVCNFFNAKIGRPTQAVGISGSYYPCNVVWEPAYNAADAWDETYVSYLNKRYPSDKDVADGRMFKVVERDRNGLMTRDQDEWIKIALAESKRMVKNAA